MTAKEIDALARRKVEIPDDTTLVETGLYYRLKQIYSAYDEQQITDEQAKVDKSALIEAFDLERERVQQINELQDKIDRDMLIFAEDDKRRVRLSSLIAEANKNGCELCKRIAKAYDGRM